MTQGSSTDLPYINSTTSLSDNAALRNYYENFLFKNASGKSLSDLYSKSGFSPLEPLVPQPAMMEPVAKRAPAFVIGDPQPTESQTMSRVSSADESLSFSRQPSGRRASYVSETVVTQNTTPDSCEEAVSLDNGLLLLQNELMTSPQLRAMYAQVHNYFSAAEACQFVDHCKHEIFTPGTTVHKFVDFLEKANLNYNPNSTGFLARNGTANSAYINYKPLVLVCLKNGKLELLSLPNHTNVNMARDDVVIIDGDRGKDMAAVVEPKVSLHLALFINFLKKKIHFDSLITSQNQHTLNKVFVEKLKNDSLDPRLYDVMELTQLIIPTKQLLRFATPQEVSAQLENKFADEIKALSIALMKLKTLPLNIQILNAKFQYDRKKLTFYYTCQERNDFRDLIKELFRFYKTRIWLCALPNNLKVVEKYYKGRELQQTSYGSSTSMKLGDPLDNFQIGVYMELVTALFN